MTKIQKERVGKLIEALKSKKYKQGDGQLRQGNKFCCLGVACDIYHNDTGKGEWITDDDNYFFFLAQDSSLPETVRKYFGFKSSDPELLQLNGVRAYPASVINDEFKFSFKGIADAFEHTFLSTNKKKNNVSIT